MAIARIWTGTEWRDLVEGSPSLGNVYSTDQVDAMYAAHGESINARRSLSPIATDNRINTYTHGYGVRTDTLGATTVGADQIRASLIELSREITFKEMGFTVSTPIAASLVRLGIAEYDFATKTATNILDLGTVDTSTAGDKTRTSIEVPSALWTRGPGWIALLLYFSHNIAILGGSATMGYSYNTTGSISCTPVQTGTAFSAFSTSEVLNTSSTANYSTWLVAA